MLCQITSQTISDRYAISISEADFTMGGLNQPSNIRPNRIFTASQRIIVYKAGEIIPSKLVETIDRIVEILHAPLS